MLQPLKRSLARRQRAARVCAACGRHGTTDTPLMFVVDENRYYHLPHCMPAGAQQAGAQQAAEDTTPNPATTPPDDPRRSTSEHPRYLPSTP